MSRSLELVLRHAVVRSAIVTALAVSAIGLGASFVSAVALDDAEARALAHDLAQELGEGARSSARDVLAKETTERSLGVRSIEAWDGSQPLTAEAERNEVVDGCHFEGGWRRCRASVADYHVIVRTPLGHLVALASPVALAVVMTALLSALALAFISRRSARAAARPLVELEAKLRGAQSLPRSDEIEPSGALAEVDALALALRAALERAEIASSRETRFVADAAHELRTPLTRLQGQLELVAGDVSANEEVRARIGRARASVVELARLSEALLAMARGELPEREAVDLSDTIAVVVDALEPEERTRVTTTVAPDAITSGEPGLLEHALRNLVTNALLHGAGAVHVVVENVGSEIVISVTDEGKGIPDAELERVKIAFVRGPSAARGSGIGLALATHVATLHGGTLHLANRARGGLLVEFTLPRWAPR